MKPVKPSSLRATSTLETVAPLVVAKDLKATVAVTALSLRWLKVNHALFCGGLVISS